MKRTRCLFVLPSMRGGGAERVASLLLAHLDPARLDLHLALVCRTGPYLTRLPEHVTVHDLQAGRVARSLVPLVRTVRRVRPDVVFSMISHMNLAATLTRPAWPRRSRLVLRETATCRQILRSTQWPGLRQALYRKRYRHADIVICQSRFMRQDLHRTFAVPEHHLVVVPNPVDLQAIETLANVAKESPPQPPGPHVVALGRLQSVKGIDRLLAAFPALVAKRRGAQLWLLGNGPLKPRLSRQASQLGIADRVHFVGFQRNPYRWLRAAHLMALPSHCESGSNALLESVACRCPPVALRHPGGTREMLGRLGLADRFVRQLDTWPDAWFQPLPTETYDHLRARHAVSVVSRQYHSLLEGSTVGEPVCC